MKIQQGIVKYKDRTDIKCTYGLTDDGKQYYFLDDTDAKKFSNGNRIVTTALVEAIDPMVKAKNVGVIDGNGVIVVPLENRSIRPVNDNVIVVEKATPTSPSVLEAENLRNDPAAAAKLVSTPATIKDRLNAQMGTEGKYIFNDQFSEATICDINGSNLVNGEAYSFISMANDKLYLSKNTADSPISEFSLSTYEMLAPTTEAIDVSTAVVDTNVVEDALNSQAVTDTAATPEVPVADTTATPEVPVADAAATPEVPVADAAATPEVPVADAAATPEVPVADAAATPEVPVADAATPTEGEAGNQKRMVDLSTLNLDLNFGTLSYLAENKSGEEAQATDAAATPEVPVAEVPTAAEGLAAVDVPVADVLTDDAKIDAPAADTPAGAGFDPSEIPMGDIPVANEEDLPTAEAEEVVEETPAAEEKEVDSPMEGTTPIDPAEVAAAVGATSVEDDVLASIAGEEDNAPMDDDKNENADSINESLSSLEDAPPIVEDDEEDAPPIVEEDDLSEFEEIDVNDDHSEEEANDVSEEEISEDTTEEVKFSDSVASGAEEEEDPFGFEEIDVDSDPVIPDNKDEDTEKLKDDVKDTSAVPVPIDAQTVLATVDKNKNGVIDREEATPEKEKRAIYDDHMTPLEREFASDIYDTPRDSMSLRDAMPTREDYGYLTSSRSSYGSGSYPTPSYGNDYSSIFTDVKPDRITYDDFSVPVGKDNIMADIARSMSELMRQNKEQRSVITQYQERVEGLEAQNRILSEKFKDQSARYEALSSKLRSLDEASARLESRNQLLDSRIHDQEKIIASQDRELKVLRPQIEGKQDLVRLLADARTLLGSESNYGYKEEEGYYRRAA